MKESLISLLGPLDNEHQNAIGGYIFQSADIDPTKLSFFTIATTPTHTSCNQCEEMCHSLPLLKNRGEYSIWCEPRSYGRIIIDKEYIQQWRLDLKLLAQFISSSLGNGDVTPVVNGRVYDLGSYAGHTLILMKGITWADAQEICKDRRICNVLPLLITIAPPPAWLEHPAIWLGQLLTDIDGVLGVDKERLKTALPDKTPQSDNVIQLKGELWLIKYGDKEIYMKQSNGMVYIQHLLYHPLKGIAAITLNALVNKSSADSSTQPPDEAMGLISSDEVMDYEAKKQIQNRIELLRATDPDSDEISELEAYMNTGTYSGKSKKFVDDNKRCAESVSKAIDRTIKNISQNHPKLGKHLTNCITKGNMLTYAPEQKIIWQ